MKGVLEGLEGPGSVTLCAKSVDLGRFKYQHVGI